ncbi:MAG: sugar ABC transporter ATP-binding protein [Anaerolineae bacterium]|nr:sugar ABC transporter ATP-binding protein [Anaerolineae bacterium]
MQAISKAFPGVQALDSVDFEVSPGEVVALIGENGAGKSTLMKILCGAYRKDCGRIFLDGKETEIESPQHAQWLKISTIYQEFNLTPNQSAAANIFLSREPRQRGIGRFLNLVDRHRMEQEAQQHLERVGARVPSTALIRDLSVAEQQMVEVAKALSVDARIVIMDEPTSALGEDEVETLFDIIHALKVQGIAVIFITHRMEEIFRIADRVVVLRDGRRVGDLPTAEATPEELIRMMVGRELVADIFHKDEAKIGEPLFEVRNLTGPDVVQDVSFTLRRGEILGFAGLVGAGRTEAARLLFGAERKESGKILIEGRPVRIDSPEDAVKVGLSLVPEDRSNQGLILGLPVQENIVLPTLGEHARAGWINRQALRTTSQEYVDRLNIRTPHLSQKAMYLSGGNQQKVVVAKWLASKPKVLILDEPTRGIDVGTKAEVHALMSQLAQTGIGIIMISSELPEILGMSDRILVMSEGRVATILSREEATQEVIMTYASGETDNNLVGQTPKGVHP